MNNTTALTKQQQLWLYYRYHYHNMRLESQRAHWAPELTAADSEQHWLLQGTPVNLTLWYLRLSRTIFNHLIWKWSPTWSLTTILGLHHKEQVWANKSQEQLILSNIDCSSQSAPSQSTSPWRMSVWVSSFSYFFLATCDRLNWSLSFWVYVELFFRIVSYHMLLIFLCHHWLTTAQWVWYLHHHNLPVHDNG